MRRHMARSLLMLWPRLVLMGMVLGITFAMIAGAYSAISSLSITVENIQQDSQLADLEIQVMPEDMKNMPDFSFVDGVTEWQPRLILPGKLTQQNSSPISAVFYGRNDSNYDTFNKLRLLKGELPDQKNLQQVALERNCSLHHDLQAGDRIELKVGEAAYSLLISGIVLSPEYLVAPLNPEMYVPTDGSLCVLFGSWNLMHQSLGFRAFNSLLFTIDEDAHGAAQERIIKTSQERLAIDYAITKKEQFSNRFIQQYIETFKIFLPAVVAVFVFSALLVVMFLMHQWVSRERAAIGLFLMLGYDKKRLTKYYFFTPLVILILLSLLSGIPLAYISQWAFSTNYAESVGMPEPGLMLAIVPCLSAMLTIIAAISFGMWRPARAIMAMSPLNAFEDRNALKKEGKKLRGWTRRIQGAFWFKYGVRNLIRSAGISSICFLSIGAVLSVTNAFYVSVSSMERSIVRALENDKWTAVVDFDTPLWHEEMARFDTVIDGAKWSGLVKGGVQIVGKNETKSSAHVLGINVNEQARRPPLLSGSHIENEDAWEIVVEQRLATAQDLDVGQSVTLVARGTEHSLNIVGIHAGGVPAELLVPRNVAAEILGMTDRFTGAFVLSTVWSEDKKSSVLSIPQVHQVMVKEEVIAAILSISSHIWSVVNVAASLSIGMSILFLMAAMTFTITARQREYGALRLQGFGKSMVLKIVLTEALILIIMAAIISFPVTIIMSDILNQRLSAAWLKVYTIPHWQDFAKVMIPAFFLMPLSIIPALASILQKPVSTWTKERGLT